MVKINSVVSLLALSSNAFAFGHRPNRHPIPVEEFVTCTTELGRQVNRHVPTHWNYKTRTVTYTERFTTTPHPTVTPTKTKTKTVTSFVRTVTTEPAVTDIATITSTGTAYFTTTNVVTETDIETDTTTVTTTPTTTIPAPADFTPISQEPGFVPKIKGRSANSLLERGNTLQCKGGRGGPSFYPPLHPQSVTCTKIIEPIVIKRVTVTAKACTRTARPVTKTATSTVLKTFTHTEWPCEVTSTVTATATTTITSAVDSTTTTTTTSTTTESTVAPQQTLQAVCGPANIISTANGGEGISSVSTSGSGDFVPVSGATTPYSCCLACFNSVTPCRGSLSFSTGSCFLVVGTDGVCHANQFTGIDSYETAQGPSTASVSNGPCGMLANGGSVN
ncbi:hypothetical protein THARTR1_05232 [Trichoderma harzianum]|uniref:Apple domain-containing protein n=1 Tax=Trichoderma harzianum TaxID=5544 RepID=A0A2K0U8C1_TRIHA|nr:hypothetical protein THARTR1_05232 [Trichoderma harzianum]